MTFQARPEDDHKAPISVAIAPSANGRHLVRHVSPDQPYFHLGDTAWELLHRLSRTEAEHFLRNRAAKGFTGIMVTLLAEHGGLDYPNRDGEWAFLPSPNSTQESYQPDLMKPNPRYFAFLDDIIPLAASLGITIWLTPTWGRYINGGYYGSPLLWDEKTAHSFGSFLGERYPFHPYVLGGDSVRFWNEKALAHIKDGKDPGELEVKDFGPISEAMAQGLIAGEKKAIAGLKQLDRAAEYKTFITFHSAQVWLGSAPEASSSAQFPDVDWLSLDVVQTGHHDSGSPDTENAPKVGEVHAQTGAGNLSMWYARSSYVPIRKMYAKSRSDGTPRPVMDLEPHYENTHHFFDPGCPFWTARDIRSGAWQAVFAGACGYTYGCNSIWQFHNAGSKSHPPIAPPTTAFTDWYLELDLEGAFTVSAMRKILESLPDYFDRVPDQSLILSSTNEPSDGSRAGDKLISAMRSKTWLAVHSPHGGDVEVRLDKETLPGQWRAWWMSPKNGAREVFERGNGGETLKASSPTQGSIDEDWILFIDRDGDI